MPPSCRTWPKTVRAIRSNTDTCAARNDPIIRHRNRATRKVDARNMVAAVGRISRPAAIVKAVTSIVPAPARKTASGVLVRVKGSWLLALVRCR